jgi:Fe-S-cluster-containing hydrogenase component 2
VGGKAIVVDQEECIGCMTCTRVCPSRGAINVGEVNKLPFINPSAPLHPLHTLQGRERMKNLIKLKPWS